MNITWYVEDGYAGHGPHEVEVDDEDLEGLTMKEQDKVIEEYVKGEFEQTVSFYWKRENVS